MERDDPTTVLMLLIKELNIPVTRKTVYDEFQKHPSPTSLLAMSDLLNNWGVPNGAYDFTFDELMAAGMPTPFIAHTLGNEFTVVTRLDDEGAVIAGVKHNKKVINIDEFKKLYAGSALIAEKDEASGEADYKKKRRAEIADSLRIPFTITGAVIVLAITLLLHSSSLTAFNRQIALLTLFKTAGLVTSILLLVQSIDSNNPLVQKLCGSGGGGNCNAILSSKAAKVTEWLSWSEAGFFCFAGTWLVLLFNSAHLPLLQMLAILNIISLPYTFYSIYYQWLVAKQWCVLCSTVQAILWLEFFAFVPYLLKGVQLPDLEEWGSLVAGMAMPVLAWVFVKPYLLKAKQTRPLRHQLHAFKYNAELFQKTLNEETLYALPTTENSLISGNPEAEHIITMVSNPYCQPCARMHKVLGDWLDKRDDIKLQIVFSTDNNENDPKTEVAAHLLNLHANHDDVSLKKAMHDWHEHKYSDYKAWGKAHPATNSLNVSNILETHKEWCQITEIIGTPTLFLNGRRLPNNYQPEDIKYFI